MDTCHKFLAMMFHVLSRLCELPCLVLTTTQFSDDRRGLSFGTVNKLCDFPP